MTWLEALALVAAGLGAGTVNAVIGSGGLLTFSTLVAFGYPPVVANVTSNLGIVFGSVTGVYGYRRELVGQRSRVRTLSVASLSGGFLGAVLLLRLPSAVFDAVVPVLILVACGLMVLQPRLAARVAARRVDGARDIGVAPLAIGFATGIYGGYFGAAQGVIILAMLAVFVPDDLRRSNALKNVLTGSVNAVAAVVFVLFADVAWRAAGCIALGAVVGGAVGAHVGRRIAPMALRVLVVVLGTAVATRLLLG